MNKTTSIMIVGVGGQGTLLTSRILGGLFLALGQDVKVSEVHGMAQRGGSVVTYVRSAESVAEPIVEEGQADILIAFERLEALRYAHFLKKDGVLIVNDTRIDPISVVTGAANYPEDILQTLCEKYETHAVDANQKAATLGNPKVFNLVVLGLAAKYLGIEKDRWIEIIKGTVPPKTVDINLRAFEEGYAKAISGKPI